MSFDTTRLDATAYNELRTARDRVNLQGTIRDYMAYVKTAVVAPSHGVNSEETQREMQMADKFIHLINNDKAWPLAQAVSEDFSRPMQVQREPEDVSAEILQHVIQSVKERLSQAAPAYSDKDWHEDLLYRQQKAEVEYIYNYFDEGSTAGGPSPDQRAEEELLRRRVEAQVSYLRFVAGEGESGDGPGSSDVLSCLRTVDATVRRDSEDRT